MRRGKTRKSKKNKSQPKPVTTTIGPDYEHDFDSFNQDVLGESDSESDDDYERRGKGNQQCYEEEEEKVEDPYMFFDFRRGRELFPENVEIIDPERADDLLQKATAEVEAAAKLKKSDKEEDDDIGKGKKPAEVSFSSQTYTSWNDNQGVTENEEACDNGSAAAVFETLKDGSTALIIKPGYRLKLNVSELLDGGDEKKEERRRAAEKEKKRRAKMGSKFCYGPSMDVWGGDAWGKGGTMGGGYGKWYKEYINAYTITMDIKLLEAPPREGLSLYQTALIHSEENKRSGKTALSRSDGECVINQAGGVGLFGTYGDTTRARIEVGAWKRVVVTVKCASSAEEKGELRTWVGTEPGVVLKEESIVANERFALDPDGLFLFSSAQTGMMPGNIALRSVRVEAKYSTDLDVKTSRARDKVLCMFDEERRAEVAKQRQGLSLAELFPKPRPMWMTPSLVGVFGDAFVEKTTLEGSSNLAWSYTVLNFVLQKVAGHVMLTRPSSGLDHNARVGFSDTLHVMQQSVAVFKQMLRMLKTSTESQLLSFLRKLKKILQSVGEGDSLLLPLLVENREILLLLQRTSERTFKLVVIQTDPFGGLKNHAVSATESAPEISYRTCLVLDGIPKKNALDDVFWAAAYNLAVNTHHGDTTRFYDVLLPFLTGKPLEESLVEAEVGAQERDQLGLCGEWRRPQRSQTAYVRCVIEALRYMLRSRGLTDLQCDIIHLALCTKMVEMVKNDLVYMLPDENGQKVCELVVRELSHYAVIVTDKADSTESLNGDFVVDTSVMLGEIHQLVKEVSSSLSFCRDDSVDLPPLLNLDGPMSNESDDPSFIQFKNMMAWDMPNSEPDPGQTVALGKYIPVDLLQIPRKAVTRKEAISAIRMCDKICTLIENQSHCIKNDKFIILSVIEHVFTQVVPIPKPRGIGMTESELYISERSSRRASKKAVEEVKRAEEKAKRLCEKRSNDEVKITSKIKPSNKKEDNEKEESVVEKVECFGEELLPDFEVGKEAERAVTALGCIWDGSITYELQVELLLTLQRLSEHFAAAAMSIQQSRPFDAVCVIVPGCMCAVSDAIMRKIAVDEPSEMCAQLMGRTAAGRQLGHPGFGISVGSFATQTETIEVHYPELNIARTAVLDYFQSPSQNRLRKIFSWEEDYVLRPGKELIKYLRMVGREIAIPISRPHMQLCDAMPTNSYLMKNYPELQCYRDVAFWWKFFLNTDRKVFMNYTDPEAPQNIMRRDRMSAQLVFTWDDSNGGYEVSGFGTQLKCRPDPRQTHPVTGKIIDPEHLPSHRFPSTATPFFYVPPPKIKTEDDVIYRPNLPSFDDKFGQVLNQRDSELLISYLTVPYMRLPLLITFFSSEDRIHKLQSPELRNILDSVMFEPGMYMAMDMGGVEPKMVPTRHPELLSTPYGLLLNELYRSPDTVLRSILDLLKGALAMDTGSVVDEGAKEFNTSTMIILYITRLAARVDNYLTFLICWARGEDDYADIPLREVDVYDDVLLKLEKGRADLRQILHVQFENLFEDYLKRLDKQTSSEPNNESLIDRNSRLACDLHAHKILLYRNSKEHEFTAATVKTLIGSFVYLTTRHTWNKATAEGARMHMPETELYEILQVQRRRLISWATSCRQGVLDEVMQTALQVSSSLTGSLKASAGVLDKQNRWSRIQGKRSCGRWAVGSTRTAATTHGNGYESGSDNIDDLPPAPALILQTSYDCEVGEVADTGMLGVEIDTQLGQMTLRSKHLAALISDIANHPDVMMIFGDSTIQASLVERAENRQCYRLVGLNHELEYWPTAHTVCPPLGDEWEREYDPAELFDSERWIVNIFEPIRKTFFNGPQPPPMQFMLPEKALPNDAEVAVLLGLHPMLGGPFKLVYLFKRLRCLHVYECVSQGREWWYSLHLTTDTRYTLREMQPSIQDRQAQYPDFWIRGAGSSYPAGCNNYLVNDIDNVSASPASSVLVVRDQQHPLNLSGGREVLVPSRLMYGLVPDALLDAYTFWEDESIVPQGTVADNFFMASRGYKRLRGYPNVDDGEFMIFIEISMAGSHENISSAGSMFKNASVLQCTGLPGRTISIIRRPKKLVERDFRLRQRIASVCESLHLLARPTRQKNIDMDKDVVDDEMIFKVDSEVECDYEGKGEYWPCVVRRVNDNSTYDIEYVNDYKWVGIQRGVDPEVVQKRGESEKRARGEGVWHWEGMSDSEDDDFRSDSDDERDHAPTVIEKERILFCQFNELGEVIAACNGNEEACIAALSRLGSSSLTKPFTDVKKLASAVASEIIGLGVDFAPFSPTDSEDMVLLNLLYAPQNSRLFSIMKTLSRIENVGHICAWTKTSNCNNCSLANGIPVGCPPIDLVELPRLKLSFVARPDHEGIMRLYSVDHVDIFISNERNSLTAKMLTGIPHSLLVSNVRGETQVLVPVIPPHRPHIATEPFSTFLVLNRKKIPLSERYFLYPVHVSLSFLLTKGLNSAVYLMLLRFLHRDYAEVFRLADSIATDTRFNTEGDDIFSGFSRTNNDWHPDAHACRLKISLVTIDSGTESPWDLTIECARHIAKLDSVSSSCRLAPEEELQLLESDIVVTSSDCPCYNKKIHDDYSMALCYNRIHQLRAQLENRDAEVLCRAPPRTLLSNWPYYQDNTVFGENYAQMVDITTAEDGDSSWAIQVCGGDTTDAPPEGWLVVACFHTLWSSACIKVMPAVTELVPLYQDMATFLSVRADCHGIAAISKSFNITTFPTFIFFRNGIEIDRVVGAERVIEKIIRAMGVHLNEADKVAHARRRHRFRLEKAVEMGLEASLEDEIEESGGLEWTWDPEQCGESLRIEKEGMLVVMRDFEDEDQVQWEWALNNRGEWKEFSSSTSAELEKAYKKGIIYEGHADTSEVGIWPSDVQISSYEITGFYCSWNVSGRVTHVRRRGDRCPVPNEEEYLSKEQKERDERSAQWREKMAAYKKKLREEKYGNDIEAIKGTIGMLPNTGVHTWTMRWNHEPARRGVGDGFGICGDGCEEFGPAAVPCLGGKEDAGSSLALYANGLLYHKGVIQQRITGTRNVSTEFFEDEKNDGDGKNKKSRIDFEDLAPLYGKDCLVTCELDTGSGGILKFFVDSNPVCEPITGIYSLLGATEIFPCVCLCPFDYVEEEKSSLLPSDECESKQANCDNPSDDDTSSSHSRSNEDNENSHPDNADESMLGTEPSVTLLLPGWEEREQINCKGVESAAVVDVAIEQDTMGGNKQTDILTSPSAVNAENITPAEQNVILDSPDEGLPDDTVTKEVEVPISRIRWMWESDAGWQVYSTELSRELEDAMRDGKSHHSVSVESNIHECNLQTKLYTTENSGNANRLRRHVLGEGMEALWEILTMKYEKPMGLTGQGFLKILEKVWSGSESMNGKQAGLGFLFLYSLLSGESRCKVIGGGYGGGMLGGGMMGGYMMYGGKGGYSAYVKKGSSTNDSHRFALLLSQLFVDRHSKSLPASVINVLGRNRQVSLRMPRFKDNRKVSNVPYFNGWVDETEPRSPLADLFAKIVPLMKQMKRKNSFRFPPLPPYVELPPPATSYVMPLSSTWDRPQLSDYGCERRSIQAISESSIANLAASVYYRLGKDSLCPSPPIPVSSMDHFIEIINHNPNRLFIVDFFATWCGPCKALAPVFRSLSMRTPTAIFLKVDVDECDKLTGLFGVESLPTVKFIRGGSLPNHVVADIKGGGPQFVHEFARVLNLHATPAEMVLLRKFLMNSPGENIDSVLKNMAASDELLDALATQPLRDVAGVVTSCRREELGMEFVNPELAFDVSKHEASKTAVASSILSRIKDDVAAFANGANTMSIPKLKNLSNVNIVNYFNGVEGAEDVISQAYIGIQKLISELYRLRDSDAEMVEDTVPLLEKAANWVDIDQELDDRLRVSKTRFLLCRLAGQNSAVWIEFLFGVLISSEGERDLLGLNPYLSADTISVMFNLVILCMLRSNRLGHTNRCLGMAIGLENLLHKVLSIPKDNRSMHSATLIPKLVQMGEELSKALKMARHYVNISPTRELNFDPRYLVFEFVWNIQLRQKQVEIVDNFRNNLKNGVSKVKQMIMGAGKTSVVAPLLALILADGKSLVLSVVPKALVEMSRTRMRETFATIMVKRIYTLDFDRSTTVQPAMRRSLENAARNRGVVVATPTTIKSIMLSYIEVLQQLKEAHAVGVTSKQGELKIQAEELSRILNLFKGGTMLLDEVDLILHPLKSELNFPIGDKFDLDGSDEGERWNLPIHLLDAIFYTHTGKVSVFEQRGVAQDILKRFAAAVHEGVAARHLQRLPHVTLLNVDFYHETMKPIMAEWAYMWLQKQHLHGIDRDEAVRYILEGAAARSDNTSKISLIDIALSRAMVDTGEIPPVPVPTLGYQKSMTDEEREQSNATLRKLQEDAVEALHADTEHEHLLCAQIRHLQTAKAIAEDHARLVNEVYAVDEQIEAHISDCGKRLAELQSEIFALHKKIAELECPRDNSMDNSVIVWLSQAFESLGTGAGTITPGDRSVPSICNILEDSGFTVKRCSDVDEAIARSRTLQLEQQLRCVIVGGDENTLGCSSSCVKSHTTTCMRCGMSWGSHSGHNCSTGGRGSFPVESTDHSADSLNYLKLMQTLTDLESPHSRLHGALPPSRTAVYCAHTTVKEDERMNFWKLGTTVTDDAKHIVSWVTGLPSWDQVDDLDENETDIMPPELDLTRQSSSMNDKIQLQKYRNQLEELEMKKLSLTEDDESSRKGMFLKVAEKNRALEDAIEKRVEELSVASCQLRHLIDLAGDPYDDAGLKRMYVGPHCGRDSAFALAWLEINVPKLTNVGESIDHSVREVLQRHYTSIINELCFLRRMALAAKVIAHVTSSTHKKLLNLCHNWLSTFLPHCLAKVNRVSFGLLSAEDCDAALKADPHVPRSRLKLAVPFVGKDVPSRSSEFAHPDVIIGLTILAYRYSGLRKDDYADIIDDLTSQFSHEIGPARDRDSSQRHERWVYSAGGAIRGLKCTKDGRPWTAIEGDSDKEVVQLKFLQKSNEEQMEKLYSLLFQEPLVIHHYLQKNIFPLHMRSQRLKISASGQSVGGDMLVGKRVGFSGTPSDLLPEELGRCDYETGDDGMMLTTVLDRSVTSFEHLEDEWTVDILLERIAVSSNPHFNALIDTGALITGYSNLEVAQQLLDRGLVWCDGVVYLDDDDKQQVLVRATGRVVSADQCGVPLEKRFAFYDQIHTTGMDIKHVVNATAVITLGKDMVFRDYVQGAYRMRGIGSGQKIHVFIIPEVAELMKRELRDAVIQQNETTKEHVLEDIVAWLIINSLRSEQVQWTMLCLQNIGNLYRKNAFRCLHQNAKYFMAGNVTSDNNGIVHCETNGTNHTKSMSFVENLNVDESLKVFDESIDFSLEAGVPDPVPFEEKLRSMLDQHEQFLQPGQHAIGHKILVVVGQFAMLEGSANRLDTEQEREQEQEQEKEVEAKKDKQIEVEKFVDREYSRQEEVQRPWPFHMLAMPISSTDDHPFYPLKEFRLRHQEPLEFSDGLYVSTNFFNPKWTGLRRVKNVVMVMEYAPDTGNNKLRLKTADELKVTLSDSEEKALSKAHSLLGFHAAVAGNPHHLSRKDVYNAIIAATDEVPTELLLDQILSRFCKDKEYMTLEEFRDLMISGLLQPEHTGRHWVALSLAEAETIRRIIHIRQRIKGGQPQPLINNASTEVTLRYSLMSGPGASPSGDGGVVLDASRNWLDSGSKATSFEAAKAHNSFRFFDCDMHYAPSALNILLKVIHGSIYDRERFFLATVGCKRRMERKWRETPVAKVFTVPHQWLALKQAAQAIFFREALRAKKLTLWEAFTAFDYDNTGFLSPSEFYGALVWLGVPDMTSDDVADFFEAADSNRDGVVDYKEYIDMLTDASNRMSAENAEEELEPESGKEHMSKVEPYGAEEIREVMVRRKQAEIAHQKEERLRRQAYKDALDVKVFEEELETSKRRKGGANPVVSQERVPGCDFDVTVIDYKFSSNEFPLRLASTGKCSFIPIFLGTAAYPPLKPMTCPKNHKLGSCYYRWMNCAICHKRRTHYYCTQYCGYYVCASCYDSDIKVQELDRCDPSKNPTFLRCSNGCSFTLQIPAAGGLARGERGSFVISLELRFEKLPPQGHLQSLLRFSLPDIAQARRMHRTSVYLNGDGVVVSRAISRGGMADPESSRRVRPGLWHVVSISVQPEEGLMNTYVNGALCHTASGLDPYDLRLQHKVVVLGGGRQAHTRGGDIRRVVIHAAHLSTASVEAVYINLANGNPGIGGRAVVIQAAFRGHRTRKSLMLEGISVRFVREKYEIISSSSINCDDY